MTTWIKLDEAVQLLMERNGWSAEKAEKEIILAVKDGRVRGLSTPKDFDPNAAGIIPPEKETPK